jgi:sec-independent protein translocase protein TatB
MFGIGMPEMLLILAVALILIGPKKLPDLAKSLGRALGEFKRATSDLKESIEIETGLDSVRDNLNTVKDDLKASVSLDDEAPDNAPQPDGPKKAPEGALDQVKEAFDELNKPADTQTDQIDTQADTDTDTDLPEGDDAMGEDPLPEDKATP